MPTYTFTRTREQVRDLVLRKLGVLAVGEAASPDDMDVVYEALDLRLKEMHRLGTLWWNVSNATTDVAVTAGVATAAVPASMLYPVTLALRVNGDDQPIEIIGHREFQEIENKTDAGEPERVIVEGSNFRFWPVPSISRTVKLTYEQIIADTEADAAPDIPVGAMRSLVILVASDLLDEFSVPEPFASRIERKVPEALRTIKAIGAQRVDSVLVTPDYF